MQSIKKLCLNLACGTDVKPDNKTEEWINIDVHATNNVIGHDIRERLPFETNSVDHIYACHCVEHFTKFEWAKMKKDWYRVLKGGGTIEIRCPDLEIACQKFLEGGNRYTGVVSVHDMIYGSQDVVWQMHHQGFDKERIKRDLEEEGFRILECFNTEPMNDWQLVCRAEK